VRLGSTCARKSDCPKLAAAVDESVVVRPSDCLAEVVDAGCVDVDIVPRRGNVSEVMAASLESLGRIDTSGPTHDIATIVECHGKGGAVVAVPERCEGGSVVEEPTGGCPPLKLSVADYYAGIIDVPAKRGVGAWIVKVGKNPTAQEESMGRAQICFAINANHVSRRVDTFDAGHTRPRHVNGS